MPTTAQPTAILIKPVSKEFDLLKKNPLIAPVRGQRVKIDHGINFIDVQYWLLIEDTYLKWLEEKTSIFTNSHPDYAPDEDLR